MTAHSLIIAMVVGLAVGVAGRVLACRNRTVPMWLPVAAAVAAAILATVIARMANSDRTGPTVLEFVLQALFAGAGVVVVAVTADRRPADTRWNSHGQKAR